MKVTHSTTFVGICPVDGSHDIYQLTVSTDLLVTVEDILEAIRKATDSRKFQEEITESLARLLPDCSIETVGVHSGVETRVSAGSRA